MRWLTVMALVLAGVIFNVGCQVTVEDFRPVHLRGGGESTETEPKPEPKPEPPRPSGKDVIFVLGLNGID
jgi:hypothetical protein